MSLLPKFKTGELALGLVVGSGAATLFFLFVTKPRPDLSLLLSDFIKLEDTVAQWIMTLFSMVAAYLLWRTYSATRDMAAETQEIGRAQVMAHPFIVKVEQRCSQISSVGETTWHYTFLCQIQNSGQTPAYGIRVHADLEGERFTSEGASIDQPHLAPNAEGQATVRLCAGKDLGGHVLSLSIRYDDVFNMKAATDDKHSYEFKYRIGEGPIAHRSLVPFFSD